MSMEWSHATEAQQDWRAALSKKGMEWLRVCLAEIQAREPRHEDDDGTVFGFELNLELYEKKLEELRVRCRDLRGHVSPGLVKDELAEEIWEFAEKLRTTDNTGSNCWCCPWGCHTVN